jgi:hypothetical protein
MDASAHLTSSLPADLGRWLEAQGEDLGRAWRDCPHARWLLSLALAVELDRALIVRAAAELASAALAGRDEVDPSALSALRTALAWLDGRANASEAWACGFSASAAAAREADPAVADAIHAAAFVAFACDDKADATFYAHRGYATKAAEAAERVLAGAPTAADRVRARIPVTAFLEALATVSRRSTTTESGESEVEITDSFYA